MKAFCLEHVLNASSLSAIFPRSTRDIPSIEYLPEKMACWYRCSGILCKAQQQPNKTGTNDARGGFAVKNKTSRCMRYLDQLEAHGVEFLPCRKKERLERTQNIPEQARAHALVVLSSAQLPGLDKSMLPSGTTRKNKLYRSFSAPRRRRHTDRKNAL